MSVIGWRFLDRPDVLTRAGFIAAWPRPASPPTPRRSARPAPGWCGSRRAMRRFATASRHERGVGPPAALEVCLAAFAASDRRSVISSRPPSRRCWRRARDERWRSPFPARSGCRCCSTARCLWRCRPPRVPREMPALLATIRLALLEVSVLHFACPLPPAGPSGGEGGCSCRLAAAAP